MVASRLRHFRLCHVRPSQVDIDHRLIESPVQFNRFPGRPIAAVLFDCREFLLSTGERASRSSAAGPFAARLAGPNPCFAAFSSSRIAAQCLHTATPGFTFSPHAGHRSSEWAHMPTPARSPARSAPSGANPKSRESNALMPTSRPLPSPVSVERLASLARGPKLGGRWLLAAHKNIP